MNLKVIAKYFMIIYALLVLSGVPIGYIMADIDPTGKNVPSWLVAYKYLAVFFISCICFYFFIRTQGNKPLVHGFIIILLVSGVSSVVDYLIYSEFDLFGFLPDFSIIAFSLFVCFGLSILRR